MKKIIISCLAMLPLCGCTLINEPITTSYFEEIPGYTSPRSGYAIMTGYLSIKPDVFDTDFFMGEPELLEYCQSNPNLWGSDECPTDDVIIFLAGGDMKIPGELELNGTVGQGSESINLGCLRDGKIYNFSYAEGIEDRQIFENNENIIDYINPAGDNKNNRKPVLVKISKSAYNIIPRGLTNCDVNVQSIEILPYNFN